LIALGVCGPLLLGVGGMSLRIKQNTYANFYQPAVDYLKQNAGPNDMIMGGAEFGFGLKFDPRLVADGRFGLYTHREPRYIIYDSGVDASWQDSKKFVPEFYEYFPRLLNEKYTVVYQNDAFKIYERTSLTR
jgi:hypothetical protein